MAQVTIKATPVNVLVDFLKRELGPEQHQALLARFEPEEATRLSGDLLASEVVPLDLVNRYTTLAAAAMGEPLFEFARRAGRYGAERGTRTVYKFILILLSPESVLRAAPSMWRRVYDGGELTAEIGEGRGTLTVGGIPSDPAQCGRVTGWFEFIGEKAKAGSSIRHASCRCRGDQECVWEFEWRR